MRPSPRHRADCTRGRHRPRPVRPGLRRGPVPGLRDRPRAAAAFTPARRPPHVPHPLRGRARGVPRPAAGLDVPPSLHARGALAAGRRPRLARPALDGLPRVRALGAAQPRAAGPHAAAPPRARGVHAAGGRGPPDAGRRARPRAARAGPRARVARPRRRLRPGVLAGDHLRPDRRRARRPRDDQAPLGRHGRDVRAGYRRRHASPGQRGGGRLPRLPARRHRAAARRRGRRPPRRRCSRPRSTASGSPTTRSPRPRWSS